IENYAFQYDAKLKEITIPSKVPKIENHTFDNCPELTTMTIKNPNIELAKKGMPMNLKTIYGFKGSTAETYAKENGIDFISIDLDYENNDGETSDSTSTETNDNVTTDNTTTETSGNVTTEVTNNTSTESGESETSTTEENTPVGPTETTPNSTSDINPTENAENQTTTDITATDKNTEDTGNQPTPEITTTDKNTENSGSQETPEITTTSKNTEDTGGQTTSDSTTTGKKPGNQTTSGRNNTETTKGPFDITPSGKFRIKSVKELNYHSVKLSWKKIKNGNSYKIYKAQKDGQFKLIGKTKSNIFIDSKVKPGKTYFYTIQATGKNNKVTWSVIWSTYVRGVPKKPKLTLRKSKTIWILTWGVIKDNSKGVEVYMRKGTQGKFKKVKTIKNIKKSKKKKGATGMTADVSRLKSKGTYFFKIRTYAIVNGRKIHSRWSKTRKVKK
ncbi:MAG: leucine-rich repeat protein, partial [Eubacterium sp.]